MPFVLPYIYSAFYCRLARGEVIIVCVLKYQFKLRYIAGSMHTGIDTLAWTFNIVDNDNSHNRFLGSLFCEIWMWNVGTCLLTDTQNCGLRIRQECRERFPRHRRQRKPLVSDTDMHHGTCVTHVPWCMSGSLTRGDGENVPGIPGACATNNFSYLVRGPWKGTPSSSIICSCCWFHNWKRRLKRCVNWCHKSKHLRGSND